MTTHLLSMKICLTSFQIIMSLSILTTPTMIVLTMMICKIIPYFSSSQVTQYQPTTQIFPRVADSSHTFLPRSPRRNKIPLTRRRNSIPYNLCIFLTPITMNLKHVLTFPLIDIHHFRSCDFLFRLVISFFLF